MALICQCLHLPISSVISQSVISLSILVVKMSLCRHILVHSIYVYTCLKQMLLTFCVINISCYLRVRKVGGSFSLYPNVQKRDGSLSTPTSIFLTWNEYLNTCAHKTYRKYGVLFLLCAIFEIYQNLKNCQQATNSCRVITEFPHLATVYPCAQHFMVPCPLSL